MGRGPWSDEGPGRRSVDLHGLDRESARRIVMDALDACRRAGVTRLRIIHGKGTGVLREEVRFILEGHAAVEDFKGALPRDGGDGAIEVRIRCGRGPG